MNTTYIRTAIALLFLTSFSLSIFAEESANEDAGNNLKNGYVHTPVACELGRYGDVPVSLFTGTADISIPLYTTEQQGVPFQISLSYDTRGVQICSLPTWVGQGWSLTAGGVINRVVKGAPDEYIIPKHIQEGLNGNFTNYFHCYSRLSPL